MNRKIVGSTKIQIDGITFDSKLEYRCYCILKTMRVPFIHQVKYNLVDSFRTENVHSYSTLKEGWGEEVLGNGNSVLYRAITYTPDFKIKSDGHNIFIETKGFANDVYPYKKKLFFNIMKENPLPTYFFEVKNQNQILAAINIIKDVLGSNRERI
jgi:hypothetical protein